MSCNSDAASVRYLSILALEPWNRVFFELLTSLEGCDDDNLSARESEKGPFSHDTEAPLRTSLLSHSLFQVLELGIVIEYILVTR
jgi:hypothetical protein